MSEKSQTAVEVALKITEAKQPEAFNKLNIGTKIPAAASSTCEFPKRTYCPNYQAAREARGNCEVCRAEIPI